VTARSQKTIEIGASGIDIAAGYLYRVRAE
jgi:hypothetical protein